MSVIDRPLAIEASEDQKIVPHQHRGVIAAGTRTEAREMQLAPLMSKRVEDLQVGKHALRVSAAVDKNIAIFHNCSCVVASGFRNL
jgi:hypothetical protein